jgi:adenylate kinase family enzyme
MIKGVWLFGLSGSGKTYQSNYIFKRKKKSFLIDGDVVRTLISYDLGYKLSDRIKQNKRVLNIAKLVIKNGYFPIISSVYLDPKVFTAIKKNKIRVINVIAAIEKTNNKLKKNKNVVGKSIKQPKLECEIFKNFKKGKYIYV